MLILTETAAGYAVFKAKDKILKKPESLVEELKTPESASNLLKLQAFKKFENTADALENIAAIVEGKVSDKLSSLLGEISEKKSSLVVSDSKLGNAINKVSGLDFQVISDASVQDLYRGIKEHMSSLIAGLSPTDMSQMSLGLSHSLSRHKLKFSPDKIDTMIVQAIALLDDLDKELNTYAMRVKEWYGWHFPEMSRIVQDNMAYARVIKLMGFRTNAAHTDFSSILPEDIEQSLKSAAEISMGTEITEEDLENINLLADQVLSLSEYRAQLSEYLRNRMQAIAPNLTVLVGELVGARLIAHAGSLINLAKHPASTIQILGAEKALFRALKTKHDTPKYGLIYHASLIGQASTKSKGKIARMLATKAALSLRVDALADKADEEENLVGIEARSKVESRLRSLEGGKVEKIPQIGYQPGKFQMNNALGYNAAADATTTSEVPMTDITSPKIGLKRTREEVESDNEDVTLGQAQSDGVKETAEATKRREKLEKEERKAEKKAKKEKKKRKLEDEMPNGTVDGDESQHQDRKEKKEKKDKKKSKKERHKDE